MKSLRKLLAPLWFLLLLLPMEVRADAVDDLKTEVAALLPLGTHEDKVRQFLRVRKFKITELPKQKSLSGRLKVPRGSNSEGVLVITFQFNDDHGLTNITYDAAKTSS